MYVKVRELPTCLQSALQSVGYGKDDIQIESKETVSLFDSGSSGRRGFTVMVDLATGEQRTHRGSWGGSNMFNPNNSVDLDQTEYVLPIGGAVVQGSEGERTYASIFLNPANIVPWLPSANEVSDEDKRFLAQFRSLKPAYRSKGTPEQVASLVNRGFLKVAKNGATSITTAGKNACEGIRGY